MEREFLQLIQSALEIVPQEYYAITTTYQPLGVIRERVFCYEFYHHMRCIQTIQGLTQIQIHGEIDKRGHDKFDRDAQRNPDFVFHVPGMMEGNTIVAEVKGKIDGPYLEGVYKDIETLSKFTEDKHYYQLGVLIIYNYSIDEFVKIAAKYIVSKLEVDNLSINRIVLVCKKSYDEPSELNYLSDLLKRGI